MGIFERPAKSGTWWISYTDGARLRHREKVGRRADAIDAYAKRKKEIREGRYTAPRAAGRTLSFRELAAAAMEHKKLRLAPLSLASDRQRLGHLMPRLGGVPAEGVSSELLREVFDDLRREGLCGGTVNRYHAAVSSVYKWGGQAGLVRANPCARIKRFRENENRVRWLRLEEEQRLRARIRAAYPEREPEFDLALYTGMRRGEQFTLKWNDVDLERGILTVHGKTGRRFVQANSSACAALGQLRAQADVRFLATGASSEYVCPETTADNQRDRSRWFETAVGVAGIANFHWHDMRHTFASRLVMGGADIRTVQQLLGHKSIMMTMRYAHLSPDHLQAAAEKIGRVPGGSAEPPSVQDSSSCTT